MRGGHFSFDSHSPELLPIVSLNGAALAKDKKKPWDIIRWMLYSHTKIGIAALLNKD